MPFSSFYICLYFCFTFNHWVPLPFHYVEIFDFPHSHTAFATSRISPLVSCADIVHSTQSNICVRKHILRDAVQYTHTINTNAWHTQHGKLYTCGKIFRLKPSSRWYIELWGLNRICVSSHKVLYFSALRRGVFGYLLCAVCACVAFVARSILFGHGFISSRSTSKLYDICVNFDHCACACRFADQSGIKSIIEGQLGLKRFSETVSALLTWQGINTISTTSYQVDLHAPQSLSSIICKTIFGLFGRFSLKRNLFGELI